MTIYYERMNQYVKKIIAISMIASLCFALPTTASAVEEFPDSLIIQKAANAYNASLETYGEWHW